MSSHLNPNSDVYCWALEGTRKPLSKKLLKMFGHLGQVSTLNLDVHHWSQKINDKKNSDKNSSLQL